MDGPDLWNRVRFDPRDEGGHVESHFLKATSPDASRAIWLKTTFLSPRGRPDEAVGEAWAIAFERGRPPLGAKESVVASAWRFTDSPFRLEVAGAVLEAGHAAGALETAGRRIEWDLRFEGDAPPFLPFPYEAMYAAPLPRFKILSPYPDVRFDGHVDVDGTRWEIQGWPGMQGHNWGREHAIRYAWAHCNAFEGEGAPPETWFEGFTGQVRIGPFRTPPITLLGLSLGGKRIRFDSLAGVLRRSGKIAYCRWSFHAEQDGHRIEGEADAPSDELAGLRYENPRGPVTHCLNSKLAHMEVRYTPPHGETVRLESRAAALEIGTHDRDHGIEMIL